MVWFYCDGCCDTIKKPKLVNHFRQCGGHSFTCVDCSRTFDRQSAQGHSTCVSEHEKYALGVTKPGGYASQGFYNDGQQQQPAAAAAAADKGDQEVLGMEFLSERPPWRCSCCNVNCTSRDTLLGHATGVKHKRRARAALGLTGQQQQQQQQQNSTAAADEQQQQAPPDAADKQKREKEHQQAEQESDQVGAEDQPASKKPKKEKKDKKDKSDKKKKNRKQETEDKQQQQVAEVPAAAQQQQEQETPKAKKQKKEKKNKKELEQQQQQDAAVLEPLLQVAKKKLKKKGKLGLKKLEALLKENANGSFSADVVEAVKQQLLACAEVKLQDAKLHWNTSS